MRRVTTAVVAALLALAVSSSPASADPNADPGKGKGAAVSGVVPATTPQNTGTVASGTATQGVTRGNSGASNSGSSGNAGNADGDRGNGASVVAPLGPVIKEIVHTLDGDAKKDAMRDAQTQHNDAVRDAAHQQGNDAEDEAAGAGGDATHENNSGGVHEAVAPLGPQIKEIVHTLDGDAKKEAMREAQAQHNAAVRAAAHLLNDGRTVVPSVEDPDIAIDGGLIGDGDGGVLPLIEATGIQLTA